jgi:hypothetical protein
VIACAARESVVIREVCSVIEDFLFLKSFTIWGIRA